MTELVFTNQEIASVIKDLGLPQDAFGDSNSERMQIINNWENRNIIACPGSGKTTVLLAKLLLLSRRMPFKDSRGICVLTHTNVAIDEIKDKIGHKADVLFQHPNFFGTIQSFVDKYLAIPCGCDLFGIRFTKIDSEVFQNKLFTKYKSIEWSDKHDKPGGIFFQRNSKRAKKESNNDKDREKQILQKLSDNDARTLYYDYHDNSIKLFFVSKPLLSDPRNKKHFSLKEIIEGTLMEGLLSYEYAYVLADYFISKYDRVKECLCKRFHFLFIDEMQDTQRHQADLIDKAFSDNVIRQYYGDPDQSIFDGINGGEPGWNLDKYAQMKISESKRFGAHIANASSPFNKELGDITANQSVDSCKPYIILFNDPKDVLPKYVSLIKGNRLDTESWNKANDRFNAVGFVGKPKDDSITVKSYYDDYIKPSVKNKQHFSTLISYFQKQPDTVVTRKGSRVYYDSFMNALVELLYQGGSKCLAKNRKYTIYSFLEHCKDYNEQVFNELRLKIAKWITSLNNGQKNSEEIRKEFLSYFKDIICTKVIKDFDTNIHDSDFVKSDLIGKYETIPLNDNKYCQDGIVVNVGTVHSVKGETHLATLLFETENYNESESSYFQNQMCGNKDSGNGVRKKNHRRVDYVAMTRPQKMLCVALRKNKVKCMSCPKRNTDACNWQIVEAGSN